MAFTSFYRRSLSALHHHGLAKAKPYFNLQMAEEEEDAIIENVEHIVGDVPEDGKVEDLLDGAERSPLLIAGLFQDHELAL